MTEIVQQFLGASEAWVSDGYALDVRYIADTQAEVPTIWGASIGLHPLRASNDFAFKVETAGVITGQIQRFPVNKRELLDLLNEASRGLLALDQFRACLPSGSPLVYASEMVRRDRWFCELDLQISATSASHISPVRLTSIDNALRVSSPPFDGLTDLSNWLGLPIPAIADTQPTIQLRVSPPVDLILDKCFLKSGSLAVELHAHPAFDVANLRLAVRAVPPAGPAGRHQIASSIRWGEVRDNKRVGTTDILLADADRALVMLAIGNSTVRRNWFLDNTRASNNRLLAVQHYDLDLRMVRNAILESTDSKKFEQGICALIYLLGFAPSLQVETDAPDIIVSTPSGRLALVECTTRIADFPAKIGKLVDRRGSLSRTLAGAGQFSQMLAILVCRLPRDQIAIHEELLRANEIVLVSNQELQNALERVRFTPDADQLYDEVQTAARGVQPPN